MITATMTIQNTVEGIIDPIVEKICRSLIDDIGVKEIIKDQVYFRSDHMAIASSKKNKNINITSNRFDCDYTLNHKDLEWDTLTVRHASGGAGLTITQIEELPSVFQDPKTGLVIKEFAPPNNVKVECKLTFKTMRLAMDALNKLLTNWKTDPHILNNVSYAYEIPEFALFLIAYSYKLRREGIVDFTPFKQYLNENSKNQADVLFNKNIEQPKAGYVINKTALELLSVINISSTKPDPIVTNDTVTAYAINFDLSFQFSCPVIAYACYGIIMKNQLVPRELLPENLLEQTRHLKDTAHPFIDLYESPDKRVVNINEEAYHIPFYDNWKIPANYLYPFCGFTPFLCAAFPININEDVTTIDLNGNLITDGELYVKPEVLKVLEGNGRLAFTGGLPIAIVVYSNDLAIDPETLTYNDGIVTIPNRDVYRNHRIVLFENKKGVANVPQLRSLRFDLIVEK